MNPQTNRDRLLDVLKEAILGATDKFECECDLDTQKPVAQVNYATVLKIRMRTRYNGEIRERLKLSPPVLIPTSRSPRPGIAFLNVYQDSIQWVVVRGAKLYAQCQSVNTCGLLRTQLPLELIQPPWQVDGLARATINGLLAFLTELISLTSNSTS